MRTTRRKSLSNSSRSLFHVDKVIVCRATQNTVNKAQGYTGGSIWRSDYAMMVAKLATSMDLSACVAAPSTTSSTERATLSLKTAMRPAVPDVWGPDQL